LRIADELAAGIGNNKTTSVRKRAGQSVHFGGLLGTAPIMPVTKNASLDFINPKGRMPAPIKALRG